MVTLFLQEDSSKGNNTAQLGEQQGSDPSETEPMPGRLDREEEVSFSSGLSSRQRPRAWR